MGEAVCRKTRVDAKQLSYLSVIVCSQKHDGVHVREGLVDIGGQEVAGAAISLVRHDSDIEQFRGGGEHREYCQSRPCVATAAYLAVVAKLCESLTCNQFGYDQSLTAPARIRDRGDGPAMVSVAPVQCGDQQTGVGDRAQRVYTVLSIVSDRSAGPSSRPI